MSDLDPRILDLAEDYVDQAWPLEAARLLAQHIQEQIGLWLEGYAADMAQDEDNDL